MPKALTTKAGALLDSWGRSNNRKLLDKTCPHCGSQARRFSGYLPTLVRGWRAVRPMLLRGKSADFECEE